MPGADDDRPQDARLDQHDRAHVVLRNPVLPPGHLAHQALVRMRFVVRRVAPLEVAQPKDDERHGDNADSAVPGGRLPPLAKRPLVNPSASPKPKIFRTWLAKLISGISRRVDGEHIPYDQQPVTEEKRD